MVSIVCVCLCVCVAIIIRFVLASIVLFFVPAVVNKVSVSIYYICLLLICLVCVRDVGEGLQRLLPVLNMYLDICHPRTNVHIHTRTHILHTLTR